MLAGGVLKHIYKLFALLIKNTGGNWQSYLNNWCARIVKLKDISSRDLEKNMSSAQVLKDNSLSDYIRDTSDRIMIIQCLSRHGLMANKRPKNKQGVGTIRAITPPEY